MQETGAQASVSLVHASLGGYNGRVRRGGGMADLPTGRQAQRTIMFYVYAIKSVGRNYLYVGLTKDPDRRLGEHNSGKERTTKPYAPFHRVLLESFEGRDAARLREKYLKSGSGKEWLKRQLG